MRVTKLIGACATLALLAGPAFAAPGDVTGEVDVTGHVTAKCFVLEGGETISSNFSGTINLGELAGPDGKLDPSLTGATISGASQSFTVACNSATPAVTLSATTMMGDAASVLPGYTKAVNYTARLDLEQADSAVKMFTYATLGSPSPTTGSLTAALSGNPNNVTVSVNSLVTNGNLLAAGQYGQAGGGSGGVISVTISPI